MPDRYLRMGILSSKKVNKLSWPAEVIYRRLMSLVDDYGRYESDPELLRSQLYPLKVDRVSVSDIVKWLAECAGAGLVRLYTTSDKEYLQIIEFNQRIRSKSKFPDPPNDDGGHLTAIDGGCQQYAVTCLPNSNSNSNANIECDIISESFKKFWDLYDKKVDTKKCKDKWDRLSDKDRENIMQALPAYINRTPDTKFRKNPSTWLNGKCWQDEIRDKKTSNNGTYSIDDISPIRMIR